MEVSTPRKPMQARRAEIADAILRIVATRGIASLTMANLAAEIGVTSGALFRHFSSRDEMLAEAARHAGSLLEQTFPPAELPPLERLEQLITARVTAVRKHPGLRELMLSDQFLLALPTEAADALRSLVVRTRQFIVNALTEAEQAGLVRSDVRPEHLAMIVMGTIQIASVAGSGALGPRPADVSAPQALWETMTKLLTPATTKNATERRKRT
jgi:AcrR family transcriptional regulator